MTDTWRFVNHNVVSHLTLYIYRVKEASFFKKRGLCVALNILYAWSLDWSHLAIELPSETRY
jgi:hypothetical protein